MLRVDSASSLRNRGKEPEKPVENSSIYETLFYHGLTFEVCMFLKMRSSSTPNESLVFKCWSAISQVFLIFFPI